MSTVVIKRKEWLRGEGDLNSKLLRYVDGKKCCLGFLALNRGAAEDQIANEATPEDTKTLNWPEGLLDETRLYNTAVCAELMDVNDSEKLSESEREEQITALFKKIGIEVEFTDE